MPYKNPYLWENRRKFIELKIDELLRDKDNFIYSVQDAIQYIADHVLYLDYTTVCRAREKREVENLPLIPKNTQKAFKFD